MKNSNSKSTFTFYRLSPYDAIKMTDYLYILEDLVLSSENYYPNINKWFNNKVINGIKDLSRVSYLCFRDDKPIACAILKVGKSTKFCHVKVVDGYKNENIGELLFSISTIEANKNGDRIHFTLPESLWEEKNEFFKSFGFNRFEKSKTQYRNSDTELRCEASIQNIFTSTAEKLPYLLNLFSQANRDNPQLLISIKDNNAKKILEGSKSVEIRRRFSTRWIDKKILFYTSSPKKEFVGEARISDVVVDKPLNIWEQYNEEINCEYEQYLEYVKGKDRIYAIFMDQTNEYENKISLRDLNDILNHKLFAPQSYYSINNVALWDKALNIIYDSNEKLCIEI